VDVARRGRRRRSLPVLWRIPDDLWELIRVTLPAVELRPSGGRPWIAPRRIVDGVLFVPRTGCQWKAVPREFGSGSTVHRRFQRWTDEGRWEAMWRLLLQYAEATQQLEWVWQSADASLHKAPLGGEKNGAEPDRPPEVRDQAPCPHRRRRRTARRGDHGGERARHARGWASCLMPACSVLPPAPSSTRASTKATTTPTRNGQCAADGTCRTSVAAAKNGGAVRAANVRVAGSSSAPTRGSTAFASCSYGGRRDRRTTSRSSSSPPC